MRIERVVQVDVDTETDIASLVLDPHPDEEKYPRRGVEVADENGETVAVLRFNKAGALCEVELFQQSVTLPPSFRS